MNETQINNFLQCLILIDDINYHQAEDDSEIKKHLTYNTIIHTPIIAKQTTSSKDEHNDHDYDSEQKILLAKVSAMILLFCASLFCGWIPFFLNRHFKWIEKQNESKKNRSALIIKSLLYFGGGILLCTTFLHLLPEVREVIEELQECELIPELKFPLPEMLMCSGFFLMYFIEELIHFHIHRKNNKQRDDLAFERGHSVRNSYMMRGNNDDKLDNHLNENNGNDTDISKVTSLSIQELTLNDDENPKQNSYNPHSHLENDTKSDLENDLLTSSFRGLFIVVALSLHELFEGMAIGLERKSNSVWFLFAAVSAHKLVLSFCVGVELIVAKTSYLLSIVYILTFAIVSPLGIGLGILISQNDVDDGVGTSSIVSVIFQGLACGTLLYVVFFEILSKNHCGLLIYFALLIGYISMFAIQQLTFADHGHSHDTQCNAIHNDKIIGNIDIPVNVDNEVISCKTTPDSTNEYITGSNRGCAFIEQLQILKQTTQDLLKIPKNNPDIK